MWMTTTLTFDHTPQVGSRQHSDQRKGCASAPDFMSDTLGPAEPHPKLAKWNAQVRRARVVGRASCNPHHREGAACTPLEEGGRWLAHDDTSSACGQPHPTEYWE
jgi:hypothetical protein